MGQGHLFSLPNEVVHQIADELDPDGLGSFVLTNKTAYSLSQRAIKRHQEFIEKYSALRFGNPGTWHGNDWLGDHFLFFLKIILLNPRIAHYPRSIHAAEWDYDIDDNAIEEVDNLADVIACYSSDIAALGTEHHWLKGPVRREVWRDALRVPTNQYHHLAMLLTMLPNLQTITLTSMSHDSEPLREMVWAIAAANRDPQSAVYKRALGKLTKIEIDRSDTEMGEDMTLCHPFTALPSMRLVHGRMIDGDISQRKLHPQSYDQGPAGLQPRQIEDINFDYSAVDLESLDAMLSTIGDLKRFTYDYAGCNVGSAPFFSGGIVALLREHAGHSLVRLDLTADDSSMDNGEPNPTSKYIQDQFVGDLKDFKKLQILRLNDTAFQKPDDGEIVRLVDVLPASIRSVRLVSQIQEGDSADLFIGLAEGKKEVLPRLKKLVLWGDFSLQQDTFDELRGVGIEITGFGWEIA